MLFAHEEPQHVDEPSWPFLGDPQPPFALRVQDVVGVRELYQPDMFSNEKRFPVQHVVTDS